MQDLRKNSPGIVSTPRLDKTVLGGAEHLVEFRGSRVFKHTYDGEKNPTMDVHFGYVPDSQYDLEGTGAYKGRLVLRPATPLEYVERLGLQNRRFGSDYRIEGIHQHEGNIGLTVSQKIITGVTPTETDIEKHMMARGFAKVKQDKILNDHMKGKTWYEPRDRLLVTDTKPDNFRYDQNGYLQALDLIIRQLSEENDIPVLLENENDQTDC